MGASCLCLLCCSCCCCGQVSVNQAAQHLGIVWDKDSDMRYENSTDLGVGRMSSLPADDNGRPFSVALLPHRQVDVFFARTPTYLPRRGGATWRAAKKAACVGNKKRRSFIANFVRGHNSLRRTHCIFFPFGCNLALGERTSPPSCPLPPASRAARTRGSAATRPSRARRRWRTATSTRRRRA